MSIIPVPDIDSDVETPNKTLSNPLVLIVCVCDDYKGIKRLPGNDKDVTNIRDMCKMLNYTDIMQVLVNVDKIKFGYCGNGKEFLEHFLRPARQRINNSKKHDGLLFFFSGHGNKDSLEFPGNETYKWNFIFNFFNGNDSNCPQLIMTTPCT